MAKRPTGHVARKGDDCRFGYVITGIMLTATVVSAWSAYSSSQSADASAKDANVWRAQDELSIKIERFNNLLSYMQQIEQQAVFAFSVGKAPCQTGDCLGVLSFSPDHVSEYEIYTQEAIGIFGDIKQDVSPFLCLRLANACYVLGKLDRAEKLAANALEVQHDFSIAHRVQLLRAKCCFIRGDLGGGRNHINAALDELKKVDSQVPQAELLLRQVQSHLVCASMHAALGRRDDAYSCMEAALTVLHKMPRTAAVDRYRRELDILAMLMVEREENPDKEDFRTYMADIRVRWHENQQDDNDGPKPQLATSLSDEKINVPDSKVIQASGTEELLSD